MKKEDKSLITKLALALLYKFTTESEINEYFSPSTIKDNLPYIRGLTNEDIKLVLENSIGNGLVIPRISIIAGQNRDKRYVGYRINKGKREELEGIVSETRKYFP